MSKQPGATQCPSCGKGNQSAQCWNCGCDWSLPSEIAPNDVAVQELRNIVEAKRFNRENFPDDTEFANWAQSRCRFILGRIEASRSAIEPIEVCSALRWTMETLEGALSGRSMRNADEVLSNAKRVLEKWEAK